MIWVRLENNWASHACKMQGTALMSAAHPEKEGMVIGTFEVSQSREPLSRGLRVILFVLSDIEGSSFCAEN